MKATWRWQRMEKDSVASGFRVTERGLQGHHAGPRTGRRRGWNEATVFR
jgi:hypothetical protein